MPRHASYLKMHEKIVFIVILASQLQRLEYTYFVLWFYNCCHCWWLLPINDKSPHLIKSYAAVLTFYWYLLRQCRLLFHYSSNVCSQPLSPCELLEFKHRSYHQITSEHRVHFICYITLWLALGIQAGYYSDHTINCCYSINSVNRIIKMAI